MRKWISVACILATYCTQLWAAVTVTPGVRSNGGVTLIAGANITVTTNVDGTITIASTGGGVPLVSGSNITLTTNIDNSITVSLSDPVTVGTINATAGNFNAVVATNLMTVKGFESGTNFSRLAISHGGTNAPINLDSQSSGTAGRARDFSILSNSVETARFWSGGGLTISPHVGAEGTNQGWLGSQNYALNLLRDTNLGDSGYQSFNIYTTPKSTASTNTGWGFIETDVGHALFSLQTYRAAANQATISMKVDSDASASVALANTTASISMSIGAVGSQTQLFPAADTTANGASFPSPYYFGTGNTVSGTTNSFTVGNNSTNLFSVHNAGSVVVKRVGTAPSAPAAGYFTLFGVDNGSGKMRLKALFPDGTSHTLGAEDSGSDGSGTHFWADDGTFKTVSGGSGGTVGTLINTASTTAGQLVKFTGTDKTNTAPASSADIQAALGQVYQATNSTLTAASTNTFTGTGTIPLTSVTDGKQGLDTDLTSLAGGVTGIVKGAGNGGGYSAALSSDAQALLGQVYQATNSNLTLWTALAPSAKQDANANLDDLADGSLSGDKVGMGINADNIMTGTLADARIASTIARDSEVAAGYQPLDSDLTDLADGSLTGSKVGTGINGDNVTTGTIVDARIDSAIARDSEVAAVISNTAYDATSWDSVTTIAPSKDAVRDKIEVLDSAKQATNANLTLWAELTPSVYNLLLQTETFNTTWTLSTINAFGATDTGATNAGSFLNTTRTVDPLGLNKASFIQPDATSAGHAIYQGGIALPTGSYVVSFYVKPAGKSKCKLAFYDAAVNGAYSFFDLSGVGSTADVAVLNSAKWVAASIAQYGSDGWYKINLRAAVETGTFTVYLYVTNDVSSQTYLGNSTDGLYVWGAQLRPLWSPTTYVKNTTTATIGW